MTAKEDGYISRLIEGVRSEVEKNTRSTKAAGDCISSEWVDASILCDEVEDVLSERNQEIKRLRGALKRISEMSVRPRCSCGIVTGTAAIKLCADQAILESKGA